MIKLYETKDFYLRPFTQSDITENYLAWFHDQKVCEYTSHGNFAYTNEMAIEFFENAEKNGDVIWAIMAKSIEGTTGTQISKIINGTCYTHIGNIALQNINWIDRNAEFAGIIGEKEYWGKGIGTKAIELLFEHGFNKLNLNKIYLGTSDSNHGMMNIAQKLGMIAEGRLKDHVFLNGEYEDILRYGILKGLWETTRLSRAKEISEINARRNNKQNN